MSAPMAPMAFKSAVMSNSFQATSAMAGGGAVDAGMPRMGAGRARSADAAMMPMMESFERASEAAPGMARPPAVTHVVLVSGLGRVWC
jgi:hypothetical protein